MGMASSWRRQETSNDLWSRPVACCLAHPFLWSAATIWICYISKNIFPNQTTYPHYNPSIFLLLGCIWTSRPFTLFILENIKQTYSKSTLIPPWDQIRKLASYVSLPNLPSAGIKLSNRFLLLHSKTGNWKKSKPRLDCLTCWSEDL